VNPVTSWAEAADRHTPCFAGAGQTSRSQEAWQPKIKVLQENTEHHIEEEEGELFPQVRKIWDTAKREHVARQMQDMKNKRQKQRQAA
jgi:hemerythrin-like domain-containing protein